MKKSRITRERLFAALRLKGLVNLGKVQRVYFEAKGIFSIVLYEDAKSRPGLCLLPSIDTAYRQELTYEAHLYACRNCGNVTSNKNKDTETCKNCGADKWEKAVNE
jgi:uncharacterized membrane protein YcaP (DUF421 family)